MGANGIIKENETLEANLKDRLSGRPSKALTLTIAYEAIEDGDTLQALLQLIHEADDSLRWRAAWVLEKVAEQCPSLLIDQRKEITSLAIRSDVPYGLKRLLLGILYNLPPAEEVDVALLNCLLDTMVCLQAPPGVQALAMKLAARICSADEDLHGEFKCIVQSMELEHYSPGVRAAARHCLKNKNKKK